MIEKKNNVPKAKRRRRRPKDRHVDLTGLDRWFSLQTVTKALDTTDRTLRRLIAAGKFPNADRRLGRELRWKHSTIQRYLSENGSGSDNGSTATSGP